jgi:hypothetical protein
VTVAPPISGYQPARTDAPAVLPPASTSGKITRPVRQTPTPEDTRPIFRAVAQSLFGGDSLHTEAREAVRPLFAMPAQDPPAPADRDRPLSVATGNIDYYQQRADDFRRRNPGLEPPDYYLEYGDKYAQRFASLDASDLSPAGLAWRDKTLEALQEAIETKRREDPAGFAELERDPEAFKAFAYATHPDAYVDSGLFHLPAQDIMVIAATPDIGDVLTSEGIVQSLVTLGKLSRFEAADIAVSTGAQWYEDLPGDGLESAALAVAAPPVAAAVPVVKQAERLIDRVSEWF